MPILTPAETALRARRALLVATLLLLGACLAWLTGADAALLRRFDTAPAVASLFPWLDFYSETGLYPYHALFAGLFGYGVLRRRFLLRMIGLAYLYAQVFGSLLLVYALKIGCGRPRPHAAFPHDAGCLGPSFAHAMHSFPSSHACTAAVGTAFVLLLLRSRAVAAAAAAMALLMALARIAMGEHFLSDVLAGLALGIAIAAVTVWIYLLPRWRKSEAASLP